MWELCSGSALRFAVETIKIIPYIPYIQFSLDEIVKLRSRTRSGEGQVRVRRVRRVRFGPELYNIFGFHHPPTTNFFFVRWV